MHDGNECTMSTQSMTSERLLVMPKSEGGGKQVAQSALPQSARQDK